MIFCVYDQSTGAIRARFDLPEADAEKQLSRGEGLYRGDADCRLHRIDPETGERIEADDARPDAGAVWIKSELRWMSKAELNQADDLRIKQQIRELEERQHRRVREMLAASDPQLQRLEEDIATLRAQVNAETETTSPGSPSRSPRDPDQTR